MKQLIKRYLNIGSDVLGFVRVGSNSLSLINRDNDVKGLLNGCEIFKVSNFKDNKESLTFVFGDLIQSVYERDKPGCFSIYRDHWASEKYPMQEMMNDIVANVKDRIKMSVKVRSKESSSNLEFHIKINDKVSPAALNNNIGVFKTKIKNASIVLQNFLKHAFIILNHKYGSSDNMWGVSNIKKYMEDIRKKVASNNLEISKLDFYKEMLEKNVDNLSIRFASNAFMSNPEENKVISKVLIPDMVNNYNDFKNLVTSAVMALSPLIYVDGLFKKATNYPASWFVSDDVLANMDEDYNFLIDFIRDIPSIENNVIVPLEIYGSKI